MGVIVAQDKMPSSKFTFPANLGTVDADEDFTIRMSISKRVNSFCRSPVCLLPRLSLPPPFAASSLATVRLRRPSFFVDRQLTRFAVVNPQTNYFAAPANTDNSGVLIGHSHVVIEEIDSLESTQVTDPTEFAFFKSVWQICVMLLMLTLIVQGP